MKAQMKDGKIHVDGKRAVIPQGATLWLRNQPEWTFANVHPSNVHFGIPIENGCCKTSTGWLQIVLDKNLKPKPIVAKNTKGPSPDCTTSQCYNEEEEDILLSIEWGNGSNPDTVFEGYGNKKQPFDHRFELPEVAKRWLVPAGRGTAYLDKYL